MAAQRRARRVRVTATLGKGMVDALDQAAKRHGLASRSQALETALAHWLREQRRREIERDMEAYYRSLTAVEKRENREWTRFVARAASRRWDGTLSTPFPRRGEIYFASARARPGERKRRPVLIISPDVRNRWAGDVLTIPISTKVRPAREHVLLDRGEGGLPHSSVAKCEQVAPMEKSFLESRPLGAPLSKDRMRQIESALLIALGIHPAEERTDD